MKNLKKILALVLALMMVLSVMVTASAVSFEDADSINYSEAVTVMAAAGILNGYKAEDGTYTFNPTGALNRAEAAKIIAYVIEGDLKAVEKKVELLENPFTDVPSWAAPYVLYAHANKIIVGRTETTFDPKANITGYELGKMLLIAAGCAEAADFTEYYWFVNGVQYSNEMLAVLAAANSGAALDYKAVAKKDWKVTVATKLQANGIWDSEFALSKKLTREEACYLAFNTMVTKDAWMANFDVEKQNDTVDSLGRPVINVWTNEDDEVVYSEYPELVKSYTSAVKNADLKADLGVKTLASNPTANGTLVEYYLKDVDAKGNNVYYDPVVITYSVDVVDISVADRNGTVTYTLGGQTYADYSDAYIKAQAAKKVYLTDKVSLNGEIVDGAIVTYVRDSKGVAHIYETKTVEGTMTAKSAVYKTVTIDGKQYTQSAAIGTKAASTYTLGKTSVQLDQYGYVVYTTTASVAETLVYVVDTYTTFTKGTAAEKDAYGQTIPNTGSVDTHYVYAQCVDMNGNEVNLLVGKIEAAANADLDLTAYTAHEGAVKAVTYDPVNKIYGFAAASAGTVVVKEAIDDEAISFSANGNKYYYENAEYVHIIGSKDKLTVVEGTLKGASDKASVIAIVANAEADTTNKVISKIFYYTSNAAPETIVDAPIWSLGLPALEQSAIVKTGETLPTAIYTFLVYINGEAAYVQSEDSSLPMGFYNYVIDEYGLYDFSSGLDHVIAQVENIYGAYVDFNVLAGAGTWKDVDATDIAVVDLSADEDDTIDVGDYVVYLPVLNEEGDTVITLVYIIDGDSYLLDAEDAETPAWYLYANGDYYVTNVAGLLYAVDNAVEGATITMKAGTYDLASRISFTKDVTIVASGTVIVTGGDDGAIFDLDAAGVDLVVNGVKFVSAGGNTQYAILVDSLADATLQVVNCYFTTDTADNGNGVGVAGYAKTTVQNCTFDNVKRGVWVDAPNTWDNVTVKGCTFKNIEYAAVRTTSTSFGLTVNKTAEAVLEVLLSEAAANVGLTEELIKID